MVLDLIPVSRNEFEKLIEAKLVYETKSEKNFRVVCRHKKSRRKKYLVEGSPKIINFVNQLNKQ